MTALAEAHEARDRESASKIADTLYAPHLMPQE